MSWATSTPTRHATRHSSGNSIWSWRRCKTFCVFETTLCHLFSQAERPHVGPHFLDVREALCFWSNLPDIIPSQRIFLVIRPDGILLFVVDDHFINRRVLVLRILRNHKLISSAKIFTLRRQINRHETQFRGVALPCSVSQPCLIQSRQHLGHLHFVACASSVSAGGFPCRSAEHLDQHRAIHIDVQRLPLTFQLHKHLRR